MTLRNLIRRVPVLRTLGGGRPWERSDKITLGIGILTLLLAAIGLVQQYRNSRSSPPRPALQLAAISAKPTRDINATEISNTTGQTNPTAHKVTSPLIDITLRNSGTAPSIITEADLVFHRAIRLNRCIGIGGEVDVDANYDFRVPAPWGDPFKIYQLETPFTLPREMRFEVQANDIQRLTFTVGPEHIPEMSAPWIYQIEVSLVHDDAQVLHLGTVSMLSNGAEGGLTDPEDGHPLKPEELQTTYGDHGLRCTRQNYGLVRETVDGPGIKSSYLLDYNDEFRRFFAESPLGGS